MFYTDELKYRREQLVVWIAMAGNAIKSANARGHDTGKLESKRLQMVEQLLKITEELEKVEPTVAV